MAESQISEDGASGIIRQIVGNAPDNQRKSILQKYYPKVYTSKELQAKNPKFDIVDKYGDDNLFFVDKSNKITVYNPPGLDFGDVASVGREIASGVGGVVGGVLASPGVATTPIGVALGSEGAGQLYDIGMDAVTPGGVKRPLPQNLIRAGENIGMEAIGGKLADSAMRGIKTGIQKGTQTLSNIKPGQRANDFDSLNIQPTVATLTGSRGVANVEEVLGGNIFAADIIGGARDKLLNDLTKATKNIANKIGVKAGSAENAGSLIRQGSKNYFDKLQIKKTNLYNEAFDAAGDVNVNLGGLRALKANLETELAKAPNTLKDSYQPSLNKINSILKDADANGGVLPLNVLRNARTEIGKIIGPATPGKIKIESTGDGKLNAIYKSLSEDIFSSVNAASPNAARLLKKADAHNRFVSKKTGGIEKTIADIQAKGLDSQVYSFALLGGKEGGQRIKNVFQTLNREERDAISSTVFSRLGYNKSQWSATTFINKWSELDGGTKRVLFGSPRLKEVSKEIDSLVRITRSVDERRLLGNPSGTGKVNIGFANVSSLIAAGGLALTGDPEAGVSVAAATILAPKYAAKLLTSPKFIRWVKSTAQVTNKGINPLSIQFGKLAALPGKDGELGEAINAFTENLKQNISSSGLLNF